MEQVRWLTEREERVWRLFAVVLSFVLDEVEGQLQRDAELTHFGYVVLSALSEMPDRSMRMSELAEMANGSRSRLSHLVAALERRGLIRRERFPHDGRGSVAVLTEQGYAKVVAAAPGHVTAVRSAVFDALSPQGLGQLEVACTELLGTVGSRRALPPWLASRLAEGWADAQYSASYGDDATALVPAIGDRVRRGRQARGWTLDRLAEVAGVSRRMLINVEKGVANPTVGTLQKLGSALGVGLPALVEPPSRTG
ncbi:helix-turn-helix domain-containing protein [Actinoplanes subtropicus]|uniref:helix-turn-helix domain-containing protein n=1 Tax=Actinoplanes subtropicus TaxID=543632 RepID=UPI000AD267CB|nr:helix-turn-helix domain-containing protein [Actinoplanes subtropicus]